MVKAREIWPVNMLFTYGKTRIMIENWSGNGEYCCSSGDPWENGCLKFESFSTIDQVKKYLQNKIVDEVCSELNSEIRDKILNGLLAVDLLVERFGK